jgi:putative pyruvate formate lyase activating enzyme
VGLSPRTLMERARRGRELLRSCRLCPRSCGVDRLRGERGFCGAGFHPRVAAVAVHEGEEPPISGTSGSGNIFFTGCNLACFYCQNYPISRLGVGKDLDLEELAGAMLNLQGRGVHALNLVTPTPWIPQILEALSAARSRGLTLPIVFNSGGYESLEALSLLDGAVDVYLPDMKYASNGRAFRYSRAPRYAAANKAAVAEMVRQVGTLVTDDGGIAVRGVLVRHLVLPGGEEDSLAVLRSLGRIDPAPPLSLMFQYFPAYRAVGHPLFGRRLWREECRTVARAAEEEEWLRGWKQDYG